MNQEEKEKINKNPATANPGDIALKAQEAFREFEKGQATGPEQPMANMSPNDEIAESLREFELKQKTENIPKRVKVGKSDTPRMVRFVIKYSGGLIKDQKQAEYVLLGITLLFFLISGYLFFGGNLKSKTLPIMKLPDQSQFIPHTTR